MSTLLNGETNSLKFGTSGLRGLATDLLAGGAGEYVGAFCDVLLARNAIAPGTRVYLAHDNRESSPALIEATAATIEQRGLVPVSCGTVPTPALALHAMGQFAPAIMITGSHIPADRNGLKFYRADGEIDKTDEQAISQAAQVLKPHAAPKTGPLLDERAQALAAFQTRCLMLMPNAALEDMCIGIYAHTSVAAGLLQSVLEKLGAAVFLLGESTDFVPIDTESISAPTVDMFRGWASEHGLDAIVSTDADADRPLVADETGTPLRGDLLGLLAAYHVNARAIVTPVTSNSGIRAAQNCAVVRTKVGSPFVLSAMADPALPAPVVGFEANGGTLLQHAVDAEGGRVAALPTRDCMLPILATLVHAKQKGVPLSQVGAMHPMPMAHADRLPDYPTQTGQAFVADLSTGVDACRRLVGGVGEVEGLDITDGARITLADGRIVHFRPSGNAPELRCYSEAPDHAAAVQLVKDGLALASAYLTRN